MVFLMKVKYIGRIDEFYIPRDKDIDVISIETPVPKSGRKMKPWYRIFISALNDDYLFPSEQFDITDNSPLPAGARDDRLKELCDEQFRP
jgi:hypothetical protein